MDTQVVNILSGALVFTIVLLIISKVVGESGKLSLFGFLTGLAGSTLMGVVFLAGFVSILFSARDELPQYIIYLILLLVLGLILLVGGIFRLRNFLAGKPFQNRQLHLAFRELKISRYRRKSLMRNYHLLGEDSSGREYRFGLSGAAYRRLKRAQPQVGDTLVVEQRGDSRLSASIVLMANGVESVKIA